MCLGDCKTLSHFRYFKGRKGPIHYRTTTIHEAKAERLWGCQRCPGSSPKSKHRSRPKSHTIHHKENLERRVARLEKKVKCLEQRSCNYNHNVKGPRGPPGPPGPRGHKGSIGPRGYTGQTGLTGPRGQTGLTGSVGPRGLTGFNGPPGPEGQPGTTKVIENEPIIMFT